MYSWTVVCIELDEASEFDDCRAVDRIGFLVAENVRTLDVDVPHLQIERENAAYHVERADGERISLRSARDGTAKYVRTLEADSADDPLRSLPRCHDYDRETHFGGL